MYIIDFMDIQDVVFVYQMHEEDEIRWHSRHHRHAENEFELHYFLQGNGHFQDGNTRYSIDPGTLFLTSPSTFHTIQTHDTGAPITYYAVLFSVEPDERDVLTLLHEGIDRDTRYNIGTNYRFFFEEIREKGLSKQVNLRRSAVHQVISFLYQLSEGTPLSYGGEESIHLEKALRFMQNHVMESITLSDIANHLRLNESYFIRLFRRRMHTTPMKYYTKLKIEAAGAMLASTTLSVKEIADRLCFYSEFHFSRNFKQHTGIAPSYYRVQYLQELRSRSPNSETVIPGSRR